MNPAPYYHRRPTTDSERKSLLKAETQVLPASRLSKRRRAGITPDETGGGGYRKSVWIDAQVVKVW